MCWSFVIVLLRFIIIRHTRTHRKKVDATQSFESSLKIKSGLMFWALSSYINLPLCLRETKLHHKKTNTGHNKNPAPNLNKIVPLRKITLKILVVPKDSCTKVKLLFFFCRNVITFYRTFTLS